MGYIYEESKEALIKFDGDMNKAVVYLHYTKRIFIMELSNEHDVNEWHEALAEFGN